MQANCKNCGQFFDTDELSPSAVFPSAWCADCRINAVLEDGDIDEQIVREMDGRERLAELLGQDGVDQDTEIMRALEELDR